MPTTKPPARRSSTRSTKSTKPLKPQQTPEPYGEAGGKTPSKAHKPSTLKTADELSNGGSLTSDNARIPQPNNHAPRDVEGNQPLSGTVQQELRDMLLGIIRSDDASRSEKMSASKELRILLGDLDVGGEALSTLSRGEIQAELRRVRALLSSKPL